MNSSISASVPHSARMTWIRTLIPTVPASSMLAVQDRQDGFEQLAALPCRHFP